MVIGGRLREPRELKQFAKGEVAKRIRSARTEAVEWRNRFMIDTKESKYKVMLLQPPAPPSDLGEMTETELYGYLGGRLGEAATESLRSKLEKRGAATAGFKALLGLKFRVDIRRLKSK